MCLAPAPALQSMSLPDVPAKKQPVVATIKFTGPINEESAASFLKAMDSIARFKAERVFIEINTGGGDVDSGFLMAKAIEEYPGAVTCIVDGEGDSEGFFLLQSCGTRLMTRRSLIMAHEPFIGQAQQLNGARLRSLTSRQAAISFAWTEHAANRMKITPQELRRRISNGDWWMNCNDALKYGAIDRIATSVAAERTALITAP